MQTKPNLFAKVIQTLYLHIQRPPEMFRKVCGCACGQCKGSSATPLYYMTMTQKSGEGGVEWKVGEGEEGWNADQQKDCTVYGSGTSWQEFLRSAVAVVTPLGENERTRSQKLEEEWFFSGRFSFFSHSLGKSAFVRPTDLSLSLGPPCASTPTLCSEAEARLCRYNSAIMLSASSSPFRVCECACRSRERPTHPPHHHFSPPFLFPLPFSLTLSRVSFLCPPPPPHELSPPYAFVGPESQPLSWSSAAVALIASPPFSIFLSRQNRNEFRDLISPASRAESEQTKKGV